MDTVAVGICQIRQGYDFEDNLSRAYGMIDDAAQKGAEIAVLPEMFFSPYEPVSIRSAAYLAERAVQGLQEIAARRGIMIVAGSMPWRGDDRRFFNRSFVFGRSGEDLYQHDKIHLFDCSPPGGPSVMESDFIMPGDALGSFETPWGPASVIVCYDIRFSPVAQILADKNIRLLFVPAAFSLSTGTAHWEILVRVRALEIQGFVVGVQPAHNPGLRYVPYGHSLISSPWGRILYDAGQEDAADVVNIDLSEIRDIRERFPLLAHRRRDLYTTSWLGGS
ncbi:MAG TPA: nitrilase-related carbon-nitrogen hydrolase [Deltaproteobacteria bacterium]|nr:nitrilase-related carbon-nitrogen hydrolase [Deltaproteobacteria bacterium]